jgi:membrane protease YdiL (CAAX protease family)
MNDKTYPSVKNVILLCLLFLCIQTGLGLLIGVSRDVFQISDISVFMGVLTASASIISFGIILLIGFKRTKRKFIEVFKFNKTSPFLWFSTIIFMIGLVIVTSELDNILNFVLPMPEMFKNALATLIVDQNFAVAIIVIAIIPALTEELFFRGLVLDGFTRNYTRRKAILLSALFFGIIHLNPWQFLSGFIIGLFSAWICVNSNSIWLSICIHLFNNALYAITVRFKNLIPIIGYNNAANAVQVIFQPLWFDLMGLLLLIIGIILLRKGFRGKAKNGV